VTCCASPSRTRSDSRIETAIVQRGSRERLRPLRVRSPVTNQNVPSTHNAPTPRDVWGSVGVDRGEPGRVAIRPAGLGRLGHASVERGRYCGPVDRWEVVEVGEVLRFHDRCHASLLLLSKKTFDVTYTDCQAGRNPSVQIIGKMLPLCGHFPHRRSGN
jgi:hypothetical protein